VQDVQSTWGHSWDRMGPGGLLTVPVVQVGAWLLWRLGRAVSKSYNVPTRVTTTVYNTAIHLFTRIYSRVSVLTLWHQLINSLTSSYPRHSAVSSCRSHSLAPPTPPFPWNPCPRRQRDRVATACLQLPSQWGGGRRTLHGEEEGPCTRARSNYATPPSKPSQHWEHETEPDRPKPRLSQVLQWFTPGPRAHFLGHRGMRRPAQ